MSVDGGAADVATVRVEARPGVVRLTLDRPAQGNALSLAMARELTAAVIETITVHLVEDLEELLGARFHERRLELVLDRSLPRVGVGVVSAP